MKLQEWKKRDRGTPAHIVPLSTLAIEILQDLYPLTSPKGPVFRSMAKRSESTRYMSDNTINSALRPLATIRKSRLRAMGSVPRRVRWFENFSGGTRT